MGSVKIDVINKNLYNGKNEIGGINNDGSLNNNADRWRAIDYINVENSTDISINIYNITTTGALGKYCLYDKNYNFLSSTQIININTVVNVSNVSYFRFWFLNDKVPTNTKIQVETGSTPTTYAQNQSQTAIMPIQQEMLEGDYIKDVEHHEWQKFIFDGVTNRLKQKAGTSANNLYYTSYISNLLAPTSNGVKIEICSNCFKSYTANQLYGQDLVGVAVTTEKRFSIGFGLESSIDTLDKANEKLKELYDAGTPIIIYYKLAEAIDLELTSEQKAIRDTKLYTYKNITNIDISDELASIDVEYKKNPATEHDDLQNQIDEIKQLISTTQTSALLLDNLQKDVESEVE